MEFELAPQDRVRALEHLAPRLFQDVLGWDYHECLVTDDSLLSDFLDVDAGEAEFEEVKARFYECYGIDRGDVPLDPRIVDLLELVRQAEEASQP